MESTMSESDEFMESLTSFFQLVLITCKEVLTHRTSTGRYLLEYDTVSRLKKIQEMCERELGIKPTASD